MKTATLIRAIHSQAKEYRKPLEAGRRKEFSPGSFRASSTLLALISEFYPLELWDNQFLWLNHLGFGHLLWAALGNQHVHLSHGVFVEFVSMMSVFNSRTIFISEAKDTIALGTSHNVYYLKSLKRQVQNSSSSFKNWHSNYMIFQECCLSDSCVF